MMKSGRFLKFHNIWTKLNPPGGLPNPPKLGVAMFEVGAHSFQPRDTNFGMKVP